MGVGLRLELGLLGAVGKAFQVYTPRALKLWSWPCSGREGWVPAAVGAAVEHHAGAWGWWG